jgi:hypothetical protein
MYFLPFYVTPFGNVVSVLVHEPGQAPEDHRVAEMQGWTPRAGAESAFGNAHFVAPAARMGGSLEARHIKPYEFKWW